MSDVEILRELSCLSRRSAIILLATSSLSLMVSCKTNERPAALDAADRQLKRFADGYNSLARREPNLPGVRALAGLDHRLLEGFGPEDVRLLTSALYLQARAKAAAISRPIAESDVRRALSKPIDLSRFGRPFLEKTLADARVRAATDPSFRIILPPGTIMCVDENGVTYSPALCEHLLNIGFLALA